MAWIGNSGDGSTKQQRSIKACWFGLEGSAGTLITGAGDMVEGYKANVRNTDNQVLGVVGDPLSYRTE